MKVTSDLVCSVQMKSQAINFDEWSSVSTQMNGGPNDFGTGSYLKAFYSHPFVPRKLFIKCEEGKRERERERERE